MKVKDLLILIIGLFTFAYLLPMSLKVGVDREIKWEATGVR